MGWLLRRDRLPSDAQKMLRRLALAAVEATILLGYWLVCSWCRRGGRCVEIRGIDIVFTGDPNQREEGIAPGIGQRRTHSVRCCCLADGADRPVRGDPFPRRMCQNRRKIDDAGVLVDRSSLHGGDLMLAQGLAHDLEPAGQRRIAERPLGTAGAIAPDGGHQRLFRVGQLSLGFGEGARDRADGLTGPLHGSPSLNWSKLTAPDLERLARTP